jgi:maleylpyruvate isomerase
MMAESRLFSYWRSSASYRVRIALNWKGVDATIIPVNLRRGEQRTAAFREVNPSCLVPVFESDGVRLTQSLAIIEYLEEIRPVPPLLPGSPLTRAAIRELALDVAADIHPIGNLRVLDKMRAEFEADAAALASWNRYWIGEGFAAIEARLTRCAGRFAFDDEPTLADVCLVPKVYNARRFELDLGPFPRIVAADAAARGLPAFASAAPENQVDAQPQNSL